MVRLILGFVAAALWLPVLMYAMGGGHGRFWFVTIATFTVPLTLFVAVPLYYFAQARITFWSCVISGAAIGAVGSLVLLLASNSLAARDWVPSLLVAGVLSAVVFWLVGIWKNGSLTARLGPDAP